ncbi:DUF222 domain-containing protein [Pseudonocardia nematodicida]|uniref:DUF222 domain-containing protein n=1 Tax=Pseudonocardia nematodicida TaxID=1206997 RepID=A0ABV1KD16_9PSEU
MPATADPSTPSTLTLPDLETELLGLAGHIAAAECRFLQLLAEFDRRGGWAGVGVRSCAHWLSWRAGMSMRTATEHLRVAHALTNLPRITEAFAAGRISYSKVRALTRVTGSDTAALARYAGATAGSGSAAPPASAAAVPLPRTAPEGPGSPAAAAEPVTEPESATRSTSSAGHAAVADPAVSTSRDTDTDTDTDPATPPAAHDPEVAERVLLNLALSGTASHVETVVRAVRRRTAPPSELAARRSLSWHHDTDGSLVLRGRFTPEEGAVLIAAIDALLPAPVPTRHSDAGRPADLDEQIVEREPGPAVDRTAARRADALLDLVRDTDEETEGPVVARGAVEVVVHLDVGTGTARLADGPEIPTPTAERLACDARVRVLLDDRARNRLYLGRRRRLATPAQIAALTARDCADGGGCRFPGCDRTRHLHAHHVRPWLRGGPTDIDNLILLCSHHHRVVHDHGYLILIGDSGGWDVRRPDGSPVPRAGEPLTGLSDGVVEINTRAGLRLGRTSLTPDWYGDRLDPEPILDALLPPRVAHRAAA